MRTFFSLALIAVCSIAPIAAATSREPPPMVFLGDVPAEAAPAPSLLGELAKKFVTPEGIASVVVTVLGLIGGALHLSSRRKEQIAIVTSAAFHGVEDLAATTDNTVDDKIAAGLKIADEWMAAQGWRPLKPGEQEVVKLGFKAINGASALQEKVQANALEAAIPVEPPAGPPSAS